MRKSDGRIFDISSYIESDKLYAVEYGGLVYVGNARKKQIYEINPTSSHVRKVNNANLNPVRLEGPNGDFWVAKDVNDASAIVGGYVENGTCVNQNFCLFFSDGSANALGNIGTYSWPGRSIIYADNGKIYGWTAGFSLTGGSWSEYGKILLFEFSKTPFGNGTLGQVTETTVHNSSGSGEPYPGQIPTQNDNWFDNGDKYYFTAYGYYKMEKVPGAGASFTYTSLDLSPLYGQGGAIPSLTWIDPITGLSRESRAIAKMGDYLYFKKGNSISRIGLLNGGVVEVIYTNSSVYNFTVGDNAVIAMAPGVTYRIDLTDNSIEQISEDLGIETSISL
jgi:hypothetical protein